MSDKLKAYSEAEVKEKLEKELPRGALDQAPVQNRWLASHPDGGQYHWLRGRSGLPPP